MLETNLGKLEHVDLIRRAPPAPEIEYLFKHGLVQETTYEALLKQDRKRLHRFVAETLEQDPNFAKDDYAMLLAQHWDDAGDAERAFACYLRAADAFARVYANSEAITAFDRAMALAGTLDLSRETILHLYRQRGRVYELNSQHDEALATFAALEQVARDRQDRAMELAAYLAELPIYATPSPQFDYARANILAEKAIALAEELRDRAAQAEALWLRLLLNARSNHSQRAVPDGEAALKIARELNLSELTAYILNDLGGVYVANAKYDRGVELVQEANNLWRELGNLPLLANNLSSAANFLIYAGELDEVFRLSDEAYAITEKIGNLWGQSYSLFTVGLAHVERGDFARGIAKMQECIAVGDRAGFLAPHLDTQLDLGRAYLWLGAPERAIQIAEITLREVERFPIGLPPSYAALAEFQVGAGNFDKAEEALARAREALAREKTTHVYQLYIERSALLLADARGDAKGALAILEPLIAGMQAYRVRLYMPDALFCRARALTRLGKTDQALGALAQAETITREMGSRRMRWQILVLEATLEQGRGNFDEAEGLRAEARTIVKFIADHAPDEFRSLFLNRADVRAVMETA